MWFIVLQFAFCLHFSCLSSRFDLSAQQALNFILNCGRPSSNAFLIAIIDRLVSFYHCWLDWFPQFLLCWLIQWLCRLCCSSCNNFFDDQLVFLIDLVFSWKWTSLFWVDEVSWIWDCIWVLFVISENPKVFKVNVSSQKINDDSLHTQ